MDQFHSRAEALDLIEKGGDLVGYLSTQSKECTSFGNEIRFGKKIGEGSGGAAYIVNIKGMGPKVYVAKEMVFGGSYIDVTPQKLFPTLNSDLSLGELAKKVEAEMGDSAEALIKINGGDSNRVMTLDTKFVYPDYAHLCKTKKELIYKRFDGKGNVVIPKGSYLCKDQQYSEFIIGALCGNLYRNGISANFIDVFGFTTCIKNLVIPMGPVIAQYIFMEKIDRSSKAIRPCIFNIANKLPVVLRNTVVNGLLIQILHAIATYQEVYQIQHNDLHDDNVFIEFIRPDTIFSNQNLGEAEWFHYKVGKTDLYLPWIPLLAKIGDFGLSVKYSKPVVGDKISVETGYNQHDGFGVWVPNWYSNVYDMMFIASIFYEFNKNNIFIKKILGKIFGFNIIPTNADIDLTIRHNFKFTRRPKMDFVSAREEISPAKILSDPALMGEYMKVPPGGKIAHLGGI